MLKNNKYLTGLSLIAAIQLSGCQATKPDLYHWGNYEDAIYERTVATEHAKADAYLLDTITEAERQNLKVAPGIYADYGYQLFKRGDRDNAVMYFKKEQQAFPESSLLMTTLIDKIHPLTASKVDRQFTKKNNSKHIVNKHKRGARL